MHTVRHHHNNIILSGADSMQPTAKANSTPQKPGSFTRRIGSTTYTVGVHFSGTSKDTMDDKIVRLVCREAEGKVAGK